MVVAAMAVDHEVTPPGDQFRLRLLDGLAASIGERGYRASTVADVVRHARTSKRTFYDRFASKEDCFLELLRADVEQLGERIATAVDPESAWDRQIRQAVEAYVGHIESRQPVTLSWIRELPSLGAVARPVQRRGLQLLASLLIDLSASPGFQRAGLPPLTPVQPAWMVVPSAIVRAPVPNGPLVMVGGVPAEAASRMRVPPLRLKPVVQLLLALLSTREPEPVLLMAPVMPAFWVMAALMMRPMGERPETLITGLALLNSNEAN